MLFNMDERGKNCWATSVRNILFSLGFGYVWLQQGVGCDKAMKALSHPTPCWWQSTSVFKQRLKDIYISRNGVHLYCKRICMQNIEISKNVFEFVDIKCFRDYLVKLRLGLLPLNNSAFSSLFSRDTPDGCDYCGEFEDEKHLICFCPLYENIRVKYLSGLLTGPQCYNNLLRCDTIHTARNLGAFVFYAMRIRKHYAENMTSENE